MASALALGLLFCEGSEASDIANLVIAAGGFGFLLDAKTPENSWDLAPSFHVLRTLPPGLCFIVAWVHPEELSHFVYLGFLFWFGEMRSQVKG